jgi:hypothetical protein
VSGGANCPTEATRESIQAKVSRSQNLQCSKDELKA